MLRLISALQHDMREALIAVREMSCLLSMKLVSAKQRFSQHDLSQHRSDSMLLFHAKWAGWCERTLCFMSVCVMSLLWISLAWTHQSQSEHAANSVNTAAAAWAAGEFVIVWSIDIWAVLPTQSGGRYGAVMNDTFRLRYLLSRRATQLCPSLLSQNHYPEDAFNQSGL